MVVTKYVTVLSGKYPANLYRIPDSAGCLNFTGYRIPYPDPAHPYSKSFLVNFIESKLVSPNSRANLPIGYVDWNFITTLFLYQPISSSNGISPIQFAQSSFSVYKKNKEEGNSLVGYRRYQLYNSFS
jgi:hypothetical protein